MHDDLADDRILRVDLLGTTRIAFGHVRIDARLSQTAITIFAILLLQRDDRTDREQLAYELWPDRTEADARANLRRQLYLLQNELPPVVRRNIRCDSRSITWADRDLAWVDVAEFERLAAEPGGVEAAIYTYKGEFMPRVEIEWAVATRERLASEFRSGLERAMRQRIGCGDWIAALRYVEQLLQQDPYREHALRQLMTLRYRLGDRAGALAVYHDFCRRIRAELDVDPMPETVRCHEAIVRGESATAASAFEPEPALRYA